MKNYAKFIGMNFQEWCQLAPEDERKINYTLQGMIDGKKQIVTFSSTDLVESIMMHRITSSEISDIKLIENEWFITLNYLM